MNVNISSTLISIIIIAIVTFGTRIAPFILFGKGKSTPKYVLYLGNYLPPAVMAMLIIYCLKNVSLITFPFGIPELIGISSVAILHIWKRNNLLSIIGGTAIYMIAIQFIFV
ncbi:branched-chain amino acid transporter permease [Clostridium folliculivorans]|uniref:Branched-chain amino acid transport protein AzlD n=1 Tax=Clostridium folliculivorans TaxID=2886038 RepID=A0A9W5Y1W3_9CLOT|nr:AzlD domain-containing protein [Clostridium folliculivorans]GKU24997.1 branched-chain amino acid transport protein AzlD [Clostridium folliculivorans]GKU31095.1 branched-chain amino acid transport protein AzlD [Clostridium folliculivorans]